MIDNLELIKPLLNFENKGDFYMLYIFKRKKDQTTDKSNHQSARTIKTYCVDSIEYLEKRYDEIKQLCEMFKARAYIHIQKQNHNDVALEMIPAIVKRIQSGQINQKHVFDSVVGQLNLAVHPAAQRVLDHRHRLRLCLRALQKAAVVAEHLPACVAGGAAELGVGVEEGVALDRRVAHCDARRVRLGRGSEGTEPRRAVVRQLCTAEMNACALAERKVLTAKGRLATG